MADFLDEVKALLAKAKELPGEAIVWLRDELITHLGGTPPTTATAAKVPPPPGGGADGDGDQDDGDGGGEPTTPPNVP